MSQYLTPENVTLATAIVTLLTALVQLFRRGR